MEKLPLFRFVVGEDDEAEVTAVALVDYPAIEMNWQAFKSQNYRFNADNEKRIISGPLMVADLPIYRRDEEGEYYGVFTAQDIYNLRNKFSKNNFGQEVNKMHEPTQFIEGVYMIESFIIDSKRGINSPNRYTLSDGSWFGSYKVDNDEVWNEFIKSGEFKGFSVEGTFRRQKVQPQEKDLIGKINDILNQIEE